MTTPTVLLRKDKHVGIVTLNRPEVLNAMNAQLHADLNDAMEDIERDANIHAVVLTGAGRAFCAGEDIREKVAEQNQPEARTDTARPSSSMRVALCKKPVIGAINGLAVGGGSLLASGVDIRFGSEKTTFRFPATAFGRMNSTWTLFTQLGLPRTKDLLFSARTVGAEEALRIGLLDRLVPSDRLLDETIAYAHVVAANRPEMVQGAKELLQEYWGMAFDKMYKHEQHVRATRLVPPPVTDSFKDFLANH